VLLALLLGLRLGQLRRRLLRRRKRALSPLNVLLWAVGGGVLRLLRWRASRLRLPLLSSL